MQTLWFNVSANPCDALFSFVIIIFDDESLFGRRGNFPWDSHVSWAVEVSFLTRHLQGPIGFRSVWLVFILISQLVSLYRVRSRNLETKPVKLRQDASFLSMTLIHGQSGHKTFLIRFQDGWWSFSYSCFMGKPVLHKLMHILCQLNSATWGLQPKLPSLGRDQKSSSWFYHSVIHFGSAVANHPAFESSLCSSNTGDFSSRTLTVALFKIFLLLHLVQHSLASGEGRGLWRWSYFLPAQCTTWTGSAQPAFTMRSSSFGRGKRLT